MFNNRQRGGIDAVVWTSEEVCVPAAGARATVDRRTVDSSVRVAFLFSNFPTRVHTSMTSCIVYAYNNIFCKLNSQSFEWDVLLQ